MSKSFFADLKPMANYAEMIDVEHYHPLPRDWVLLLTDVKNSTQAIEAGRYKEVNMIGVSCIVAVQNALGDIEFPFIFGGDGATLAVPAECAEMAKVALSHTRKIAGQEFGLGLRIAAIPAAEFGAAPLLVAKMRISDGHELALVRGEGWGLAEKWMKESRFNLPEDYPSGGDHAGLECRWNPLPARKSEIMALIVQARSEGERAQRVYREILHEILASEPKPVGLDNLQLGWRPKYLRQEARMRTSSYFSYLIYMIKAGAVHLVQKMMLVWKGRRNLTEPYQYMSEVNTNTDYLKFDDCLRMIIDVSSDQKASLIARLEKHRADGEIFYGTHCDPFALMTCFVQSPRKHIHFIDAGGGGYAMAAKQLKAQRKENAAAVAAKLLK